MIKAAFFLLFVLLTTGCQSLVTPYSTAQTPVFSGSVNDRGSTASLTMGAVGEFSVVMSWAKTEDGLTSGTTSVKAGKQTLDNVSSAAFGGLFGYLMALIK